MRHEQPLPRSFMPTIMAVIIAVMAVVSAVVVLVSALRDDPPARPASPGRPHGPPGPPAPARPGRPRAHPAPATGPPAPGPSGPARSRPGPGAHHAGLDPDRALLCRCGRRRAQAGGHPGPDPAGRGAGIYLLGRLAYGRPEKLKLVTATIVAVALVALVVSFTTGTR